MSDEENHFESKVDVGASKTYPQQAGPICKNGYIAIKNRPCKDEALYVMNTRNFDENFSGGFGARCKCGRAECERNAMDMDEEFECSIHEVRDVATVPF